MDNSTIRDISESDISFLWNIIDKDRNIFIPWFLWADDVYSEDDVIKLINRWKGFSEYIGVIQLPSGTPVGLIRVRENTLMYWISQESEGKGLVTKACWELLTMYPNLTIYTDSNNTKSIGVAVRLGMVEQERQIIKFRGQNITEIKFGLV